ncbi:MAG TPA: hypothetical protein VMS71_02325 [Candidatus Acidoferrum sp.]|nr:hypothetical protein [Candidatus Acidoferrum sp.]
MPKRYFCSNVFAGVLYITLLLLLIGFDSVSAATRSHWDKPGYFIMRAGFLYEGSGHVDGVSIPLDAGFTFGVGMDFRLRRNLYFATSCDIHRMYPYGFGEYFIDAAAGLKYRRLGRTSQVAFQPGFLVGYGRLATVATDYATFLESSSYLTLKSSLEIIFFSRYQAAFFCEIGAFWAPTGTDGTHHLKIGPLALIRAGMML